MGTEFPTMRRWKVTVSRPAYEYGECEVLAYDRDLAEETVDALGDTLDITWTHTEADGSFEFHIEEIEEDGVGKERERALRRDRRFWPTPGLDDH